MAASAPTDDALREQLKELLKTANLEETTARSIRNQLESHFGVALDDRKAFISEELNKLINEGDDEEEEKPAKKEKKEKSSSKRKQEEQEQEEEEREAAPKRPRAPRAPVPQSERQLQGFGRAAAPKARRGPGKETLKDPDAPKKNMSAYNFFTKEKGAELKAENPKLKFAALNQAVSKLWTFLESSEKKKYEAMAEADKVRYDKEMAAYVPPTEEELLARKEAEKQKKKENSFFNRPVKVSPQLAEVLGSDSVRRADIVKKLNEYVREHNLKDPENGAFAICDAKLEQLTGEKKVKIFGIQKYLNHHIIKAEGDGAADEDDEDGEGGEGGEEEEADR